MARRKVATTVYMTPEQEEELKALHRKTKVPVAEYIREGIDYVLEKYRRHLPGQLDMYRNLFEDDDSSSYRKAAKKSR